MAYAAATGQTFATTRSRITRTTAARSYAVARSTPCTTRSPSSRGRTSRRSGVTSPGGCCEGTIGTSPSDSDSKRPGQPHRGLASVSRWSVRASESDPRWRRVCRRGPPSLSALCPSQATRSLSTNVRTTRASELCCYRAADGRRGHLPSQSRRDARARIPAIADGPGRGGHRLWPWWDAGTRQGNGGLSP